MSKSQKKIMKKVAKFLDADQSIEDLGKPPNDIKILLALQMF